MTSIAIGRTAETRRHEAVVAGVIGNVLEWYDFAVYGYLVPVISQLFFPDANAYKSLLTTLAVFGVGFVMRPVGAVFFGILGDRYGRRRALSAVIFLMALATLGVGLLPTYAQAGLLGPVLLVAARLLQGLSAGGEWGGSTAYIVEFAAQGRRGYVGSWQQVSVGAGFLLGSLAALLLNRLMAHEALLAWGWRIPFLLGILVGLVGAWLRWRLDDTPKYAELEQRHAVARTPLIETLTKFPRQTLLAFGLTLHNTVAYYIALVYIPTWFVTEAKLPSATALLVSTVSLFTFILLVPFTGALSDRVGRRPMLIASCLGYIALTYPLFLEASSGELAWCFTLQLVLVVFLALYAGAAPAAYAEIFPTRIRYTALSVGYNAAVAIFGGFAGYIATRLIEITGYRLAPTAYVILAAVISLLILLRTRETAFLPLE
ncbi:MAG TPA: MFS transporter [Stellaceae bacterium]|nr:MFS transporter [Stellaceae bacterium]